MNMTEQDIKLIEERMDWTYDSFGSAMICDEGFHYWPSLDAIHEIELSLTDDELESYLDSLLIEYGGEAVVADFDQRMKHLLPILNK